MLCTMPEKVYHSILLQFEDLHGIAITEPTTQGVVVQYRYSNKKVEQTVPLSCWYAMRQCHLSANFGWHVG